MHTEIYVYAYKIKFQLFFYFLMSPQFQGSLLAVFHYPNFKISCCPLPPKIEQWT